MRIKVRSGDTIWYYSQLFYIPLQLIIDSNPTVNPSAMKVGENIQIPGFITERYNIKSGDTFWKLAANRALSVDALLILNQKTNPNRIQVGDSIIIPKRVIRPIVNGKIRYSYELLTRDIQRLATIYPFMFTRVIGKSVLGKDLTELQIGRGKKKVHFNGSFHANEWITTPVILQFVNDYLLALTNGSDIRGIEVLPLYQNTFLSIVPMVNPDGVNLVIDGPPASVREEVIQINNGSTDFNGWKANIRGVDLNNQYPANWQIEQERKPKAPAPRDFPGEAPLTEPEAITMANLTKEENFDRALAFHTQGREIYWGYEGLEPPQSRILAENFARVSGYRAVQYVDSHAGYKDWFIQEFRRPGFTVELGRGINPLPLSQYDQIYQEALGIFLISLYL